MYTFDMSCPYWIKNILQKSIAPSDVDTKCPKSYLDFTRGFVGDLAHLKFMAAALAWFWPNCNQINKNFKSLAGP